MAIPAGVTPLEYYNQQINRLVKIRDKYMVYDEDWAGLSTSMKNAVKAVVNSEIASVKTALDDVNAAVQGRS